MKQLDLILKPKTNKEHGGSLAIGKRKSQRPLSIKRPIHLVLKSPMAVGARSLMRHRPLIEKIVSRSKKRFRIRVYEYAVVSNHIHLLVKGYCREDLQNFFRTVAGHIAQEILRRCPYDDCDARRAGGAPGTKENKFWVSRIYSRIVSWGREYVAVKDYVLQNTLESLRLIPFQPRKRRIKVTDTG